MDGDVDPATLTWAAKFSNVPAADPGAAGDPNTGQTTAGDPNTGQATVGDPPTAPQPPDPSASQPQGDAATQAPVAASVSGGDPGGAPDPTQAPPAGQTDPPAIGTDAPKKINVTIKTSYGQTVRYWIQDRATDANHEAPEGSGTLLINGEDHGPGESIGLSCIATANGASICYQRESNANPPGGGMTPWSSVTINEGDTFTIQETAQPLGDPPPPGDPSAGQTQQGDGTTGQAPAGDPSTQVAAPVAAGAATGADPGRDPGAAPDPNQAPPAGQSDPPATGADGPKKINVSIKTSYGQTVRYWIQDRATDANNEAPEGAGAVLIDGEDHGPGESIGLSCTETPNGASVCYQRESYPNPPGGGMTPWSSVMISEGDTFTIQETSQTLGAPSPADDPNVGQTTTGKSTSGQAPAGDPASGQAPANPASSLAAPVATGFNTGTDPGASGADGSGGAPAPGGAQAMNATVPAGGDPAAMQLKLLSPDDAAKCNAYLDAHFDALLKNGASGAKAADYQPALDGKAVQLSQIVNALLPLTLSGGSSDPALAPSRTEVQSELFDLVGARYDSVVASKIAQVGPGGTQSEAPKALRIPPQFMTPPKLDDGGGWARYRTEFDEWQQRFVKPASPPPGWQPTPMPPWFWDPKITPSPPPPAPWQQWRSGFQDWAKQLHLDVKPITDMIKDWAKLPDDGDDSPLKQRTPKGGPPSDDDDG